VLIEKKKIMCIFISFYAYPSMELIKPSFKEGGGGVESNNATAANISGLDPSKTTPLSL